MSGSQEDGASRSLEQSAPAFVHCVVPGARHLREGRPCQDAIHAARVGSTVALAVADGHGTSARGDVGAELAVKVAVEQLLRFAVELGSSENEDPRAVHSYAEHPLRVQLVREWDDRVRQHAGVQTVDLQLYGSTLLFALATPTYLLVGQVGDGDILFVDAAKNVSRPIVPDPRNFAEETASLCQNDAWLAIRLHVAPAPDSDALLLLSTDGYSKSYATDAIYDLIGPDYLDMFHEHGSHGVQAQLREILEAVTSGGSGDDIALGMLRWAPPAREGPAATVTKNPVNAPATRAGGVGGESAGEDEATRACDAVSTEVEEVIDYRPCEALTVVNPAPTPPLLAASDEARPAGADSIPHAAAKKGE